MSERKIDLSKQLTTIQALLSEMIVLLYYVDPNAAKQVIQNVRDMIARIEAGGTA
jgi:hypothetical protein